MIKKEVPYILGEGGVNACKDREKVGLELLDGNISGVSAMDIRRYELELDVPVLCNNVSVVSTGFAVKDL